MCFGRRNKQKVELTQEEKNWNMLWDRYADDALDPRYQILCDYHSGINGGGHYCFFDNNEQELDEYTEVLQSLLPGKFFAVYNTACNAYKAEWCHAAVDEDATAIDTNTACDIADEYFYAHEDIVIDLLQAYANELQQDSSTWRQML